MSWGRTAFGFRGGRALRRRVSNTGSTARARGRPAKGVAFAAVLLLLPGLAYPQATSDESANPRTSSPAPAKVSADISFGAYLWLPSIGGRTGTDGNVVSVNASFTDIFDNADQVIGFMGHAEVNANCFLLLLDPVWTRIKKDDAVSDAPVNTDITMDTLWFDMDVGYRFIEAQPLGDGEKAPRITVDGLVGVRVTAFKLELDPSGLDSVSSRETWADPLIGTRVIFDFADHLGMVLRADIGGFGAGSELSANLFGALGFRFPLGDANGAAFIGYRALYQDYDNNDFVWRAWVHGPALGMEITF